MAKGRNSEPQGGDDYITSRKYIDTTTALISDALRKGLDVLQLENGDVVTTGTKIIITHYVWDGKKQSLKKLSEGERKKRKAEIDAARSNREDAPRLDVQAARSTKKRGPGRPPKSVTRRK